MCRMLPEYVYFAHFWLISSFYKVKEQLGHTLFALLLLQQNRMNSTRNKPW